MYTEQDSHDGKTLAAYRKGNYKIISGSYKDSHWYLEPDSDSVNTSDNGLLVKFYGGKIIFNRILLKIMFAYLPLLELFARLMDLVFGEGPCDNFRMLSNFFMICISLRDQISVPGRKFFQPLEGTSTNSITLRNYFTFIYGNSKECDNIWTNVQFFA